MDILLDTRAEANIIRKGLVSNHLTYVARKPLRFATASGQSLGGGDTCVKLKVRLQSDQSQDDWFEYEVEFYEASIRVDAILSYPWLAEMHLGVFPHHKALVQDSPHLKFLYGTREPGKERENFEDDSCAIQKISAEERCKVHFESLNLHLPLGPTGKIEFLNTRDIEFLSKKFSDDGPEEFLPTENCEDPTLGIRRMIIAREGVTQEEKDRIEAYKEAIIQEYRGTVLRSSVFPDPPERGRYGYAYIPLKEGAEPVRQKPFFMHGERREALEKITQQWIDMKFIEPASSKHSEWLSQTFPVPKKSATFPWRGVADMRGPNSQTRRCNYPLPHIEDILVKHGGNQMFSILDLKQAFHQQPLHPESRHITCCFTPKGVFQWRVNVMGLTNAPQQFQQMIDDRLEPLRDDSTPYIDDILVGTSVGEGEDLLAAHDRDL